MHDHTNSITWHEINSDGSGARPDADEEILIYDTYLDDTVQGTLSSAETDLDLWIDTATGETLLSPAFWAKKPYPMGT